MISFIRRILRKARIPRPEASNGSQRFWVGASYGLLFFSLVPVAVSGYYFQTGFVSPLIMAGAWLLGGLLLFWIASRISLAFGYGLKAFPRFFLAALMGAIATIYGIKVIGFRWPDNFYFLVAGIYLFCFALLAGSIFMLFQWSRLNSRQRLLYSCLVLLSASLVAGGMGWLTREGTYSPTDEAGIHRAVVATLPTGLNNPALPGEYDFDYFTYGSGTDERRLAFGDSIKYRSASVDATRLIPEWKGKKKKWRERFWGFGPEAFPLNGRTWMPRGSGPFPLVLIVHGNHGMEDFSDPGYAYLGELLASRGMIAVSVDQNFINGTWSGDFRGKEMATRAWLLLRHLAQWRDWTNDPGHDLSGKADLGNVMLIGHSRGGEAVSIAAAFNQLKRFPDDARETFDFDFGIRGIVAIAPTDYRYDRQVKLENVNFLSLQGTYDADESDFFGLRQYRRLSFTDSSYYFKAGLLVHRANHGQFNATWGRKDFGGPTGWLINQRPLLSGKDQREIAKVWVSAFAEAVLYRDKKYTAVLRSPEAVSDWLPKTEYYATFEDSDANILLNFEEDLDVTTASTAGLITAQHFTHWEERGLRFANGMSQMNNAVVLGWHYPEPPTPDVVASYSISLDGTPIQMDSSGSLLLYLAPGDPSQLNIDGLSVDSIPLPDFKIELLDSLGQSISTVISQWINLRPPSPIRTAKLSSLTRLWRGGGGDPTGESILLPLASFRGDDASFNFSEIRTIRFVFDQTSSGMVILDDIGYGK